MAPPAPEPTKPDFDPDALRRKYREERDKRLRADGNEQYVEVKEALAHFVDDPYVEPGFTREPLTDEVEVVVIGGGFGGLLAARAPARGRASSDVRIIEKGGDFGGTWYWNRYPGAQCDVESYIYLPLLEELGYVPTEKYSRAPEILAHSRAIGRKYDLYRNACFQTEVTELRWDEDAARWIVVDEPRRPHARPLRHAWRTGRSIARSCPAFPGIESFRGHSFHTSRWDYAYTGGDSNGNLTGLRGKRVGIIGTGATRRAVRAASRRGGRAPLRLPAHAVVDRRARQPSAPIRSGRRASSPAGTSSGWTTSTSSSRAGSRSEDLVSDGWTDIIRKLLVMVQTGRRRRASRGTASPRPWSWRTSRRWSRSARASTRSCATRRRRRR